MKYSRYIGRKSYCGGKIKKKKSRKNSHNQRGKSRKIMRKGYLGPVAGDRIAVTTRRVTRRHTGEMVDWKRCMRNWVDTIYKLGESRAAVDVLLQRIDLVRQSGKYVPDDTDQWKHVINLKRRKYRFENPVMNLKKEAIDPVDGFITQQVNMEMSRDEFGLLNWEKIKEDIERSIDDQDYVRAVNDFNYILHKFVYDDTYLYKDDDGDIILVRESRFVGLAKEIGILRSNIVKPVLVKKKYKRPQQVKLAELLNKVRSMTGLLSSGRDRDAQSTAEKLIKYYCKSSIIKKVLKLIEIYETQFISLIPFLPNYMFDHGEARASSDAGIEYDTTDADADNIIEEGADWSDMGDSDGDVEDMGETDGESEGEEEGNEMDVGGPHPDAEVPDDF
jgi:hypothetical protein